MTTGELRPNVDLEKGAERTTDWAVTNESAKAIDKRLEYLLTGVTIVETG